MEHIETTMKSKDGLDLFTQAWETEASCKAVVCLVHGLGEHSSRYTHVADFLNRAGYTVLAFDLRGHGRSGGKRGHSPSSEAILDDINLLLDEANRRYPGKKRFLYGHSMGGLLVLYYALARKPKLAGVISTSPGLRSPVLEQKLKLAFAKTLASVLPTMSLPTGLNSEDISRDPQVVQKYQQDPLVHDQATLAMANSAVAIVPWTLAHAGELNVPLLIMHGAADRITYPSGSQEFASRVKGDCTLKLWDGLYHETHNEPEKEMVLAYLVDWLNQKST